MRIGRARVCAGASDPLWGKRHKGRKSHPHLPAEVEFGFFNTRTIRIPRPRGGAGVIRVFCGERHQGHKSHPRTPADVEFGVFGSREIQVQRAGVRVRFASFVNRGR